MTVLDFRPFQWIWFQMVKMMPRTCIKLMFRKKLGRWPNMDCPKDINEWIQYLKFHADMKEWARLADKYAVRQYVEERGLKDILPLLYGKYDTIVELTENWNQLPKQFVLKANNGCGSVKIVVDKSSVEFNAIIAEVKKWMKTKETALRGIQPHYLFIPPCLIAEELLIDDTVKSFSHSLIDYKIWCFNGKPYCILAAFDRDIKTHKKFLAIYTLDWEKRSDVMTKQYSDIDLPRPKNLLSKGHPQMRVDLYNINGKIYFGELTMTAARGMMDSYTPNFLLELGSQISKQNLV